ncbi:MAG: tetratricopeptide repeat protein [Syntrophorhabdus sp.]
MKHMTDPEILTEKFYHSMAALLVGEDQLEEAMIYFQKAIDTGETPYAWYGLSKALRISEDIAGAVGAISRAINLAPGIPEYYHERACLLDTLGRPDLAEEDYRKARSIDPNYARIDAIRSAAHVLHEIFRGPSPIVESNDIRSGDEELHGLVKQWESEQRILKDVFERPSCPVTACPAYCCYFKGRLFLHGVTMGAWKLKCLRDHFRDEGKAENEFLDIFHLDDVQNAERLFPPQDLIKDKNRLSIVSPRQKETCLEKCLVADLPRTEDYTSLMWTGEDARPCAFFTGDSCAIYGIGNEPSLDSCSSFLCLTGFIFVALKYLGILSADEITGKSMAQMNGIAVEALLVLARDVYEHEEAMSARDEFITRLDEACKLKNPSSDTIKECQDLKARYDTTMARLIRATGKTIQSLCALAP